MLNLDRRGAPGDAVDWNVQQRRSACRRRRCTINASQGTEGVVVDARPGGQLDAPGDAVSHRPERPRVACALEVGGHRRHVSDRVRDQIVDLIASGDCRPVSDRPGSISNRDVRRRRRPEDAVEFLIGGVGVGRPHARHGQRAVSQTQQVRLAGGPVGGDLSRVVGQRHVGAVEVVGHLELVEVDLRAFAMYERGHHSPPSSSDAAFVLAFDARTR